MMQMVRKHVMYGAIAGAVLVVGVIAVAGVIIVFFAGAAGAVVGGVIGLVVGIVRAPFKMMSGRKPDIEVRPPI